jgi:phosphate transport system permease protein
MAANTKTFPRLRVPLSRQTVQRLGVGTLLLVFGTALAAVPIGVGGAIYLSEYARDTRATRSIRLAIVNLAGIPSVVYGLFGLGLFVLFLRLGTSIVAGALTLGIMTLPIVISTSEEALRAVPTEFRTVSASLGGSRWQGIRNIVLPQALPGIITGVILGLLRAAGETCLIPPLTRPWRCRIICT